MKMLTHTTHTFHALTAGVLMDNISGLSCWIHKELSPNRYLQSRHCFAELERMTVCTWRYIVCCMRMEQIRKITSTSFKIHCSQKFRSAWQCACQKL